MNAPNQPANSMIRCMDCGRRNSSRDLVCGFCGAALHSVLAPLPHSVGANGTEEHSNMPRFHAFAENVAPSSLPFTGALARPSGAQLAVQTESEDARIAKAELQGRVIVAEPVIHEHPDFDWCKVVTRLLWFLLLVVSPFVLLRSVLVHLGALPLIFAIVGFLFLLRFVSPTNILSLIHLHMLLNPLRRNEVEQVPVRYFRVRDSNEREWIVRMKGQIDGGNIATDDLIAAWGKWRSGVLVLSRAYNQRTQSYVFVRTSQSWMALAATTALICFLGIYFYGPFHTMWQMMHSLGRSQ